MEETEVRCQDCGTEIHPESTHTGHEKWCEDCFDKGLCRDMNDHWDRYLLNEMRGNEAEE